MAKRDETRERLTETAFRLLRDEGYARTTMRRLAEEAGVSLGNAYYYFPSKDAIVQALYLDLQQRYHALARERLAGVTDFTARLRLAVLAGFETVAEYHEFGAEFLGSAISPDSATNPFGEQASDSRELAVGVFREVVEGSDLRLPAELRAELPGLLWMGYMAGILFWVYDSSPGQQRTLALIDAVIPLAAQAVAVAKLPILRSQLRQVLELVAMVRA